MRPAGRSAIGTGFHGAAARRSVDAVTAWSRLLDESVYREHKLPFSLAGSVGCSWEQRAAVDSVQLIVPDGCVDLIWLAEHQLVIAGPDIGPRNVLVPAGLWSSGVRLRPGAAEAFFGRPASELRGLQVVAEDVLGAAAQRLTDELTVAGMRERGRFCWTRSRLAHHAATYWWPLPRCVWRLPDVVSATLRVSWASVSVSCIDAWPRPWAMDPKPWAASCGCGDWLRPRQRRWPNGR